VTRRDPHAGVLELLAHHAAAELLCGLGRARVLDMLVTPRDPRELAASLSLDPRALEAALAFLAHDTDVVRRRGRRFALAPAYAASPRWRGLVEKLVGAYGPALRDPAALRGAARLDDRALARAYAWDAESPAVVDTIRSLSPRGVLDLGCGRGHLLAAACAPRGVRGWGIDASPAMCRDARATLAAAGLARRVSIRRGPAEAAPRLLPAAARARIDVIHAGSLLNAHMADPARAVALLTRLRRAFPGRTLVVVDYLGGAGPHVGRYTQLTDLVQLLTGQGTPPPSHERWAALYHAAGARLVSVSEGRTFDLRWFLHVVRLAGSAGSPV
jgi:SAM-dependent methyltransferase